MRKDRDEVVSKLIEMQFERNDINFIRNIKESELESHFYQVLQQLGLTVTVESNQRGDA